jgi:hypothetical protein
VGVFPGASYGLDQFRAMVGGNVAWAATKYIMPYGELSFFPEIPRERSRTDGNIQQDFTAKARIYDTHGGVHLRIPIKESRIVPYLAVGAGFVRSRLDITGKQTETFRDGSKQISAVAPSTRNASDFAVNGGGGLRFYAGERWGFRFEAKVYRANTGDFQGNFAKIVGGLFYQIR